MTKSCYETAGTPIDYAIDYFTELMYLHNAVPRFSWFDPECVCKPLTNSFSLIFNHVFYADIPEPLLLTK